MLDEKELNLVLERFFRRYNKYNTKVLKKLGDTIKQIGSISPSQAYTIAQNLKYGTDIDDLLKELADISGKSIEDVDKLFDKVAEENVNFAETYYKAKNKEFIDYKNNDQLRRYVETIKETTKNTLKNISKAKNVGFVLKDTDGNSVFRPIKTVYNNLIDEAIYNVSRGTEGYQEAMRSTINQLADSGVKVHEENVSYQSGYNRRIDSSVKQNILEGIRTINLGIQERIGEELDANGVEISAHSPCAEDHLHIQGKQFSKKQFDRINGDLDRPIGTYNCKHFVFSIILGVNTPSYSKRQLKKLERESTSKITYEGKTYTKYEATQVQRKLETEIRKQKDRQIIARASNDKQEISLAQQKITQLTDKYNDFSKSAKLNTYKENLTVSGYRRVSTK